MIFSDKLHVSFMCNMIIPSIVMHAVSSVIRYNLIYIAALPHVHQYCQIWPLGNIYLLSFLFFLKKREFPYFNLLPCLRYFISLLWNFNSVFVVTNCSKRYGIRTLKLLSRLIYFLSISLNNKVLASSAYIQSIMSYHIIRFSCSSSFLSLLFL